MYPYKLYRYKSSVFEWKIEKEIHGDGEEIDRDRERDRQR